MVQRTYNGGRKHAISISVATVLGTTGGTLVSMLQEHWNDQARDRAQAAAIAAAVAPLNVEIDNLKQANQSQWQAIARKQDK